jgi:hypothetical protein
MMLMNGGATPCSERAHGAQRDRWINHCRAAVAANVPSTAAIA